MAKKCELNANSAHLTDAVNASVIQVVSKGAFAAERPVCVDADAVLADARVIQTLVQIYREGQRVNPSKPLATLLQMKTLRSVLQRSPSRASPGPGRAPWP